MATATVTVCDRCRRPETRLRKVVSVGTWLQEAFDWPMSEPDTEETPVYCRTMKCLWPAVSRAVRERVKAAMETRTRTAA